MSTRYRSEFTLLVFTLLARLLATVSLSAQDLEDRSRLGPACRPYLDYDLEFNKNDRGNIADCIVEMRTHDYELAQKVYEKVLSIVPEDPDYVAKAFRSAMQPIFLRAAIAAEFNEACDSFRKRPEPNPYLPDDNGAFDDLDKIMRWVERIACGMELEERRPEDFAEMAVYLLVLVDSGLVLPDKDKLWTAEDGAYLDAAISYALTHSLAEGTAK